MRNPFATLARHARMVHQLRQLLLWLEVYDRDQLDAPGGDESRARPPEGDDYNEVTTKVQHVLKSILEAEQ